MQVDIVMATYNGSRFIKEQINSLLSQTYPDLKIIVSDDGSDDETLSILKNYERDFKNFIVVNDKRQGGVSKNFNKALSHSDANYIMFCDQDDIWLNTKVQDSVNEIKRLEEIYGSDIPLCSFTDLTVVTEDLKLIHKSLYCLNNLNPKNNLDERYLLWRSSVYGCSVIFNLALKKVCHPIPQYVPMHDQWVALNAVKYGRISFVNKSNILYRQHGHNVVGGAGKGFFGKLFSLSSNIRSIYNASLKVRMQNYHLGNYSSDSYFVRFKFVKNNVFPFLFERSIYSLFFILFYVVVGSNIKSLKKQNDTEKKQNDTGDKI